MVLTRFMALLFALAGSLLPVQAEGLGPESLVKAFQSAMSVSETPERIESVGADLGLHVVKKEFDGPHLAYLEMTDRNEQFYLVFIGEWTVMSENLVVVHGDLLVTLYGTAHAFYERLKPIARTSLPDGPSHKLIAHDIPVEGVAWGADYPGLITLEVKHFADQSASQIEATWLRTK